MLFGMQFQLITVLKESKINQQYSRDVQRRLEGILQHSSLIYIELMLGYNKI